jgi:hypothetical protein
LLAKSDTKKIKNTTKQRKKTNDDNNDEKDSDIEKEMTLYEKILLLMMLS